MKKQSKLPQQQPEVLAGLAEAARSDGKKPQGEGLVATQKTAPRPANQAKQVDAATKVLREGATGKAQGADEAIQELPDRAREK